MSKTVVTASGFVRPLPLTLKAAGVEASSTTGSAVEAPDDNALSILVNVTANVGTTMTVIIEGTNDGTNWYTLATFGANGFAVGSVGTAPSNITAPVTVRGCVPNPGMVRSRSVIAGGSFTYSVTAG